MEKFITALLGKMTLDEKLGQLNLPEGGDLLTGVIRTDNLCADIRAARAGAVLNVTNIETLLKLQKIAVEETRLGIPLIFGFDVIHGFRNEIFPIPLAVSNSWDMDLVRNIARHAATEASANGIKWVFSPMVDIARDPRWGRIAEGAGEDPYIGSLVAEAMVKGYQENDAGEGMEAIDTVMACVKHFAFAGATEGGREYGSAILDEQTRQEIYEPPFRAAIRAGIGSLMASFNDVGGVPIPANKQLLTKTLRDKWDFGGFVVTDYSAIYELARHGLGDHSANALRAFKAGVDMSMVDGLLMNTLGQAVANGQIKETDIDRSCRRILEAKYKLGLFDDPYKCLNPERAARPVSAESRELMRDAVARSCVLLQNNNHALPLKKSGTVALIGPLADDRLNMLGTWAIAGKAEDCATLREGLHTVCGDRVRILFAKGANITDDPEQEARLNTLGHCVTIDPRPPATMIAEAVAIARQADVIVAAVGESRGHSGEAASRSELDIPKDQRPLLEALSAVARETGKPLVLVVMSGRPLTLGWECDHADAILMGWHGGTEAGNGIADVLFGDYNPSGKLTTTFPRSVGQLPVYYNHKHTSRPAPRPAHGAAEEFFKYTSRYLDCPVEPLFPFGFGLSYTTFDYGPVQLNKKKLVGDDKLVASVKITNTGTCAGEEIAQLYLSDLASHRTRPVLELKSFQKLALTPGESVDVVFEISSEDLKYHISAKKFDWEPGEFAVHIGANSRDIQTAVFDWQRRPDIRHGNGPKSDVTSSSHKLR